MPVVSVIIPMYNAEKFIKETIDSILNQSLSDLELIVVDNCSEDRSVEIVSRMKDTRIRLVVNPENVGAYNSLNIGIGMSRGEYIADNDADDISYPNRLETQVSYLQAHPETTYCLSASDVLQDGVIKTKTTYYAFSPEQLRFVLLFNGDSGIHSSLMMRGEILRDNGIFYNSDYRYAGDAWMKMELLKYGEAGYLAEPLLAYRVHEGQTTYAFSKGEREKEKDQLVLQYLKDQNLDAAEKEILRKALVQRTLQGKEEIDCFVDAVMHFADKCGLKKDLEEDQVLVQKMIGTTMVFQKKNPSLLHIYQTNVGKKLAPYLPKRYFIPVCLLRYNRNFVQTQVERVD